MPKGKKFNAAEKHFAKEREQLLRENRKLRGELSKCSMLKTKVSTLEKRVTELEAERECLLKKCDMTEVDLKREKQVHTALELLFAMKGEYT